MKRVLHLTPAYFPRRGGIEVLVEESVEVLRDEYGWDSSVLTPLRGDERPESCTVGNTEVFSVSTFEDARAQPSLRDIAQVFASVRAVIERINPEVIHVHWNSPLVAAAMGVAETRGIPVVMHVHGALDMDLPSRYIETLRVNPRVIAVSESVAKSVRERCKRDKPIDVILNGLLTPLSLSHAPIEVDLVMVGRLEPEKGFLEALIDLAPLLRERPELTLAIVGQGNLRVDLETLISEERLAASVVLAGEMTRADTLSILGSSKVLIVPSSQTEGFSLVALEAAQHGVPVVATRVGGLPEVVVDGETGALVQQGAPGAIRQAVGRYLDNPQLRQAHGANAQQRATQQFSNTTMVSRWAQVYREVAPDRKAR